MFTGDACEVLYGTDNGKLGLVKLHKLESEFLTFAVSSSSFVICPLEMNLNIAGIC